MRRRAFLAGMTSIVVAQPALAYTHCQLQPMGNACESGIDLPSVMAAFKNQIDPQWCWAASIQMIFAFYGFNVSQQRIVAETYGAVASMPAVTGYAITKNLERDWVDDNGNDFSVRVDGLFDVDAGIFALDNTSMIEALAAGHPLLLGNITHAMVLTAIAYLQGPNGPMPFNFGVADPYPGMGLHGARSPADLVPMNQGGTLRYVCLPRVEAT